MHSAILTSEQQSVVHHPLGRHALVLAVAGSGKTTTMAHRIKHLITEMEAPPSSLRVLMFNRLARMQFQDRLVDVGVPRGAQPPVDTFHSFSYRLIREVMKTGVVPNATDFWLSGRGEQVWLNVNIAITNLERSKAIPPSEVDPEEAMQAISLWKGSLIPPARAGYRGTQYVPQVYAEYERLRLRRNALTFDDFVPMAVGILENGRSIRGQFCRHTRHIVVDEYQDVNYGQQRLIELLAGKRADVMVVGDDDQTIYEWRGARPSYIIREFQTVFSNKPHTRYKLSRSFRFGPVIAQAAYNTITMNTNRVAKPLIAHSADKEAEIRVIESSRSTDANRELAEQVVTLVKAKGVPPSEVRVLVRTFAQLGGIEAEFLERQVPYRVVGRAPFFERKENVTLLDYIRLATTLDDPIIQQSEKWLLSVANTPSRKLARKHLRQAMRGASHHRGSTRQALVQLVEHPDSPLYRSQQQRVIDLLDILDRTRGRVTTHAGRLLSWLVDSLSYLDHFTTYYGDGWESFDRRRAVTNFIDYASGTGLRTLAFLKHIESLDTTRGAPEDMQIVMTTVFREKGCEYDFVIIPQCEEGYMPCLRESGLLVFDTAGLVEEPEPSEAIENERRLFYVALTRARKAVYIGTSMANASSHLPSRFLDEIQLEATVSVMSALQRMASGGHARELIASVKRYGGIRKIAKNLVSEYLKDVGDEALTGRVTQIVAGRRSVPFSYRHALTPPTVPGAMKRRPSPTLHRVWDKVTF